jgi:hypothetical protein
MQNKAFFLVLGVSIILLSGCAKPPEEATSDKVKGAVSGVLGAFGDAAETAGKKAAAPIQKMMAEQAAAHQLLVEKWNHDTAVAETLPIMSNPKLDYYRIDQDRLAVKVLLPSTGKGWTKWIVRPENMKDLRFMGIDRPIHFRFFYENGEELEFQDAPGRYIDLSPLENKMVGPHARTKVSFWVDDNSHDAEIIVFFMEKPK